MARESDGGPAFPRDNYAEGVAGMPLRDWFAGQALAGCGAQWYTNVKMDETVAKWCYETADAMIAARDAK